MTISWQEGDMKVTYTDYKYYGCAGEGTAKCVGKVEPRLNHIWVIEYKGGGSFSDTDDCNVCACE